MKKYITFLLIFLFALTISSAQIAPAQIGAFGCKDFPTVASMNLFVPTNTVSISKLAYCRDVKQYFEYNFASSSWKLLDKIKSITSTASPSFIPLPYEPNWVINEAGNIYHYNATNFSWELENASPVNVHYQDISNPNNNSIDGELSNIIVIDGLPSGRSVTLQTTSGNQYQLPNNPQPDFSYITSIVPPVVVTEKLNKITYIAPLANNPLIQLYFGTPSGDICGFQLREGEEMYITNADPTIFDTPHAYGSETPAYVWINKVDKKLWIYDTVNSVWVLIAGGNSVSTLMTNSSSTLDLSIQNNILTGKVQDESVDSDKIQDGSVSTDDIGDKQITLEKLQDGVLVGEVPTWNGIKWTNQIPAPATASSGITTLNGLTGSNQNFATGTTGSNFNIVSNGNTHTFNLPDAGQLSSGIVNTGAQTFVGLKTFNSLAIGTFAANRIPFTGNAGLLSVSSSLAWDNPNTRLGIGTSFPMERLHVLGGNIRTDGFIMPTGAANSGLFTSDATGQATWKNIAINSTGNDFNYFYNGTTHNFNLPDAGLSSRGVVTTGDQGFIGIKTFSATSSSAPSTTGNVLEGNFRIKNNFSASGNVGVLDFGFVTGSGSAAWLQSRNANNYATNNTFSLNPNGGNVGIGVQSPLATLHIDSKTANVSGLRFTQLNSGSPNTSETSYLAVNASGMVVKGAIVSSPQKTTVQVKKAIVQTILAGATNIEIGSWTDALTGGSNIAPGGAGTGFDLGNGYFVAPRAGRYRFSAKINVGSLTGVFNESVVFSIRSGIPNPQEFMEARFFQGNNTISNALQVDCILDLITNQQVSFLLSNYTAQNCVVGQNGGLTDFISINEL